MALGGHIHKARRDGKVIKDCWDVVVELGTYTDKDGVRHRPRHTERVWGKRDDAKAVLNRLLLELQTGQRVDPEVMTVADLLLRWLNEYARSPGRLAPTTLKRYESIIDHHLTPALGKHRLIKLRPMQIQDYYSKAMKNGRIVEKGTKAKAGPLSPTTVLQHHAVLHKALTHAVRLRLIPSNPADAVEPPRKAKQVIRALSADDMAHVLAGAADGEIYAAVVLALTCGLRRGEIVALRWRDVDLKNKTLRVHDAKTPSGRRVVAMPKVASDALRWQRRDQGARRKALHGQYVESGAVVDDFAGRPVDPDWISQAWRREARRLLLPDVRFHDLRHSHATALVAAGEHPKVISDRLGHSTVAFTLDTYAHALPDMQRGAADRFDDLLSGRKSAKRADNGQTNGAPVRIERGRRR